MQRHVKDGRRQLFVFFSPLTIYLQTATRTDTCQLRTSGIACSCRGTSSLRLNRPLKIIGTKSLKRGRRERAKGATETGRRGGGDTCNLLNTRRLSGAAEENRRVDRKRMLLFLF
ncbi:hypothetical protein Zmor_018001 [Zophobas morio]|uniref:Uncharacterized protein n=1 Tax=Zophobas morio TaxID=2755281 RepID=A0AA38IAA0_9CUCU|nr:hypothetical protein Zmor_018001 [Zophobas morio]